MTPGRRGNEMYPKHDSELGYWCPHFRHSGEFAQGSHTNLYRPTERKEFCRICLNNNSGGKHGCMNKGGSIQD